MSRSAEGQFGLTREEAIARLARDGFNELPSAKPHEMAAFLRNIQPLPAK